MLLSLFTAVAALALATPGPAEIEVQSGAIAHIVDGPEPALHGPRITGATPGRPFLFLIPATGEPPLAFSATGLPDGLALNPDSGIISGSIAKAGDYAVSLEVSNALGKATRRLTISAGDDKLALTPPMGWNPWNIWAREIDDAKMRAAADAMVAQGLAAHGYQYVNLDDTWQGERLPDGALTTNERFPDMKALGDYIHAKGLRFGAYTTPGRKSWAGYPGSYGHEEQDARMFASWGADYLKYDWCAYPIRDSTMEEIQKPFRLMRGVLDSLDRDIVYSACTMPFIWHWGDDAGLNMWRMYADIKDTWDLVTATALWSKGRQYSAGPGHWMDLDMLVVGEMKWGGPGPSRLTPDEQITHLTLWSLLASPLLLGCDLDKMDDFTRDLLINDDVLDVNQDPLGKPAECVSEQGNEVRTARLVSATPLSVLYGSPEGVYGEVWARPLADGTIAAGLINLSPEAGVITARWQDLKLRGPQPIRDLWQRRDLGVYDKEIRARLPSHGALMVKIGTPRAPH